MFPKWERIADVQIIAKSTLKAFWARHPWAETPLRAWCVVASRANWSGPADIKAMFGADVDFVGDYRVIFDIGGNTYRFVVHVAYAYGRVLVKFAGTHADYDEIDAETV